MTDHMPDIATPAGRDLRAYTDELRPRHRVIENDAGYWVLLRHADVVAAALDDVTFSSDVSRFLQVPNGLDGDEHTRFRRIVDRYLTRTALEPFVPVFERIAAELVAALPRGKPVDAVSEIGAVFAVRAQCAWLGWPADLEPRLLSWMEANHAATRSGDLERTAEVAGQFDAIIRSVLAPRLADPDAAPDDVTTRLCRETVDGRALTEAETVSILRNWTGGDLGSIALCVGVLIAHVTKEPAIAQRLRSASDAETDAIIDEILRLDDPFVSNRRITTCPVRIGGKDLPANARVKLHWTSANRDEAVFGDGFAPEANAAANLVYGIGRHVCPGRLLATWQLRIALRAILDAVDSLAFAPGKDPEREVSPVGGYRRVPIVLR
ncbi:cytochrome P450 [Palleronia sediminis]|uniref:Cytochrome P450 n=2 Tax=Palleronia sediminis TaxID=2547833 RepID=A0A4R6AES7_9RHOB|nr:cytochrome P450 [Palleronia sediminis]